MAEDLIYKLLKTGIYYTKFLTLQKKTVVLNGQQSYWKDATTDFFKVSILGPLLFPIYINGSSEGPTEILL